MGGEFTLPAPEDFTAVEQALRDARNTLKSFCRQLGVLGNSELERPRDFTPPHDQYLIESAELQRLADFEASIDILIEQIRDLYWVVRHGALVREHAYEVALWRKQAHAVRLDALLAEAPKRDAGTTVPTAPEEDGDEGSAESA